MRCNFKLYILLFSHSLLYTPFQAADLQRRDRAFVTSPSGSYKPVRTQCPNDYYLRGEIPKEAQWSAAEQIYVTEKSAQSIPLWREYLQRVNLTDFDIENFLESAVRIGGRASETLPTFGFALSGGSMRSLCLGAAVLDAFDGRNEQALAAKVGGLVQLGTYASGLSGLPSLNQTLWKLYEKHGLGDWNNVKHYPHAYHEVKKKKKAKFPTSMVDAWGRVLSKQFIDDSEGGEAVLWSSIRLTESYKNRTYPFVITLSLSRPGTHQPVSILSPLYEMTSEDWSVFNPRLNASIPIDFLGSPPDSLKSGSAPCVAGFENAGFIMGLASNFFSFEDSPNNKKGFLARLMSLFIDDEDYEGKVPNTFKGLGYHPEVPFADTDRDTLLMGDPGLASENLPLFPLIQPFRRLDLIIAVDSSLIIAHGIIDPNGTSLYMTYRKTQQPEYTGYRFPRIPNSLDGTFSKLGFNEHPTVFGCYEDDSTPLVVYLPNYKAVADTDYESGLTTYSGKLVDQFFANGFAIASQSDGPTKDPEWPACLACFLIDKQLKRDLKSQTLQCQECFDRYCAKF
ncbi:hypothetical protein CROQUDRAFT_42641 [Cronartium quercuum f. sp. fusiforme G11]|uniref:Lysophospholipase n=1 Tax=Cronartium quercuum f. sp. fusiforme G11 TaxID=708437 RepID=A0A9P6NNT8_9BASI|nr:hypothetical protein CROQUDRAFT_42641 [Cronartium quercuum f. sp. fusiforme G11]